MFNNFNFFIMGNKHVNGDDPYIMSPSEAAKEAQSWIDNGGSIRHDEANKHSPDEHYHFIDNNPNEDLLVIVDPDLEPDENDDED